MTIYKTLSLCSLLGLASAQIVKEPLVEDAIHGLSEEWDAGLPKAQTYVVDEWTANEVSRGTPTGSDWSKSLMEENNEQYCADEFTVQNVTYADCPEPWLIGHCGKAQRDLKTTIDLLGRLPSNLRGAVSDLIHVFMPRGISFTGGSGSSAAIAGGFKPVSGVEIAVRAALFGEGIPVADFEAAVKADSCVADETSAGDVGKSKPQYAGPAYRAGMVVAYEKLIGKFPQDSSCMSNQLKVVGPIVNAWLDGEGQCPNKMAPEIGKLHSLLFPDGIEVLNSDPVESGGEPEVKTWEAGSYPKFCWDEARGLKEGMDEVRCAPENIEVYDVKYPDCPDQDPWTICRCKDAQIPLDEMLSGLGGLPPALRSYVRHIMAFDGLEGDGKVHTGAGTIGDVVILFGHCTASVYMHEAAHCIDREFHDDPGWMESQLQDSCIPTQYARSSSTELFAEVSASYIYNVNSTPLKERGFDPACMANQMKAVGDYVGTEYTRGTSKCFKRKPNSPIVDGDSVSALRQGPYISEIVVEDFEYKLENENVFYY